jgi:hypothetical protein
MDPVRPARSLHALTDSQLGQYRKELERSLRGIAQDAPVRELIQQKITVVAAEQEARQEN